MLKPKKKISRRELKEDALITSYVKATGWYEQNKKYVQYGLLTVIAVVVVIVILVNNRKADDVKAMTELAKVTAFFDNGQYQLAIDGSPERNIAGLRAIVDNYGSSSSGELARFYLAGALYQLGRYDEALEHFKDFSAPEQVLAVSRLQGIGSCYEAKKEYGDAASAFEKAALTYAKDVHAAENLQHAARNYDLAGDKERALELYRKIKKESPTSSAARDVDRHIARLSI